MVHTNVHRNLQQQKLLFTPQIKANIRVSWSHFPRGEVKYKLYARISFSFSGRFLSKIDLISALMALTAKGRRGRASVDKHLLEFQFPNSMGFSYVFFCTPSFCLSNTLSASLLPLIHSGFFVCRSPRSCHIRQTSPSAREPLKSC